MKRTRGDKCVMNISCIFLFRNVGHNWSASLFERPWREPYWNGHYLLHHNPTENAILHSQLDFAHRADFLPLRPRLLLASRGRRESNIGYFHSPLTGCVLVTRIEDPSAYLPRAPPHCQVPLVHFHYEHVFYFGYRRYHQLELQRATNTSHATLDTCCLS